MRKIAISPWVSLAALTTRWVEGARAVGCFTILSGMNLSEVRMESTFINALIRIEKPWLISNVLLCYAIVCVLKNSVFIGF